MIPDKELSQLIGLEIKHEITMPDDTTRYEYGKIVDAWYDNKLGGVDCRIQIYENWDPNNKGSLLPGTLRYWVGGLIPIDSEGNEIILDDKFYPERADD